ncbi:MAG: hypothetical protein WCG23_09765 [bacterium]
MSTTTTIRVKRKTYNGLKIIADQENSTMQDALDKLLEEHETKKFFEELNQSVTNLKSNSEAWIEELNERKEWEETLADGLENEKNETW